MALLSDFRIAITASEIPAVPETRLATYSLGDIISHSSIYPQGKLFKDETGKIWQVKDNLRHEVDPLVWQNRFNSQTPESINSAELEKYASGKPAKLKDGALVISASSGKYYLISNGQRLKIEDLEIIGIDLAQRVKK